jgi:hypothetical protein
LKKGMRRSNRNMGTRYPSSTVRLRPPRRRSCERQSSAGESTSVVPRLPWAPLLSTPAAGFIHDLAARFPAPLPCRAKTGIGSESKSPSRHFLLALGRRAGLSTTDRCRSAKRRPVRASRS